MVTYQIKLVNGHVESLSDFDELKEFLKHIDVEKEVIYAKTREEHET